MILRRWVVGVLVATMAVPGVALPDTARHVPAYDLPTPSTVSPELQARMANAPPSAAPPAMPATNAGWARFFDPDPAATQARIARLLATYRLAMAEETIAGVHCYRITPSERPAQPGRLLVHLHGGAHVGGAGQSGLLEAVLVAGTARIETVSVDYRMAPSHPFPAAMDDATAVWTWLGQRYPAYRLGVFGTSSGGGMVLALTQRAIAAGLRVPDAIMAGTPWSDLSETGDSYFTNRYADPIVYQGMLSVAAAQYADGLDLKDSRLSPVYGSFAGFPPTLLLAGTRDIFLSNTVRVDRKLRDAGRRSELIVYEGQSHSAYLAGVEAPETATALNDISTFFAEALK
ncbi:MAG: alpha/beta hydrolase fold domain-containing protein [Phenylobacterium sp.]|uniref:alpha/beta hydrolase fold domain-containing protein n=1 Tax=Phenylobacterium sp. TaxID=1871053 RepID=UPI0025DDA833|nr:alpha/beta hydrolase fold domain-containing protein [Phenylobacterium sp.]MBI1198598.1 alpha/beta hydrolase fold domain-containing protein [Phenylobacterium sp.]